jgi:hypothetical protein
MPPFISLIYFNYAAKQLFYVNYYLTFLTGCASNRIAISLPYNQDLSQTSPRVGSAQCHRRSTLPEPGGQCIGVGRTRRVKRDPYQVGRCLKIDRFNRFIRVKHVPMGRHKCCEIGHRDLLEV